jgi:hypothetical protein
MPRSICIAELLEKASHQLRNDGKPKSAELASLVAHNHRAKRCVCRNCEEARRRAGRQPAGRGALLMMAALTAKVLLTLPGVTA